MCLYMHHREGTVNHTVAYIDDVSSNDNGVAFFGEKRKFTKKKFAEFIWLCLSVLGCTLMICEWNLIRNQ